MIIGIKETPVKGEKSKIEVFYSGHDGLVLRKKHAELLEKNESGNARFYLIQHPLLVPLQNVVHSTEDHPDHVSANQRREALAVKSKPVQVELKTEDETAQQLAKKSAEKLAELRAENRGNLLKLAGDLKIDITSSPKKSELINLILVKLELTPVPVADLGSEE